MAGSAIRAGPSGKAGAGRDPERNEQTSDSTRGLCTKE